MYFQCLIAKNLYKMPFRTTPPSSLFSSHRPASRSVALAAKGALKRGKLAWVGNMHPDSAFARVYYI